MCHLVDALAGTWKLQECSIMWISHGDHRKHRNRADFTRSMFGLTAPPGKAVQRAECIVWSAPCAALLVPRAGPGESSPARPVRSLRHFTRHIFHAMRMGMGETRTGIIMPSVLVIHIMLALNTCLGLVRQHQLAFTERASNAVDRYCTKKKLKTFQAASRSRV